MRLATIVVLGLAISCAGLAQDKQIPFTASLSGAEMFKTWCASCHGTDAKGNGPAAAALKKMPANLTQLAKQSGGKFPTQRVREYIDGTGKGSTLGPLVCEGDARVGRRSKANQRLAAVNHLPDHHVG